MYLVAVFQLQVLDNVEYNENICMNVPYGTIWKETVLVVAMADFNWLYRNLLVVTITSTAKEL